MDGISESISSSENFLQGSSNIDLLKPVFDLMRLKLQEIKDVISDTADRSRVIKELKLLSKDLYTLNYSQIAAALTRNI